MNQYKKSRMVVVGSVVALLSISLLFLTAQRGLKIPFVTDGVHQSVSFVNQLISRPAQLLAEKKDEVTDLMKTYAENKELKATIAELKSEKDENASLKNENASLRANLAVSEQYADKRLIPGLVSVRMPTTWVDQLEITVGSEDGVAENMLVMANGGLVGIVTTVFPHSATVRLLSNVNENTKIPVKILTEAGTIYGILSGYDTETQTFIVDQLNDTADIPAGSQVVTSDLAGNTASNLQIGTVASVKSSSSNLNRVLYITPAADFSTIYAVTVVGEGS